jgi:hypothetical protein
MWSLTIFCERRNAAWISPDILDTRRARVDHVAMKPSGWASRLGLAFLCPLVSACEDPGGKTGDELVDYAVNATRGT